MIRTREIVPPGRLLAGLVARGLLAPSAALDHVVTLEDRSRSNPVSVLSVDGAPLLVAKQRGLQVDGVDPLAAEGAAYAWLAGAGLEGLAPGLLASPEEDGLLVIEALSPVLNLQELLISGASGTAAAFRGLGAALGRLHRAPIGGTSLELRRPWVLDIAAAGLPAVVGATAVVAATRERLLASPAVSRTLDQLRASWTGRSVIHGDVKFDNVLVEVLDGLNRDPRIWLIDWELAGLGVPAWDLAGVVEGTLTAQLMTLGRTDAGAVAALVAPALRAHGAVAGATAADDLLAHTAARTAQAALQLAAMAATEPDAERHVGGFVDLAISLATEPAGWAHALLRDA